MHLRNPIPVAFVVTTLLACFEDPAVSDSSGDGDGDGSTGDGDGDGTPGDGDGDGDGDGTPGDGDGDGDGTPGDGDGTPGDGDGDGDGDVPLGTYHWHLSFPGFVAGVAPHQQGLLVVGNLTDTLELPSTTLVPNASDVLLLGLELDGNVAWGRSVGGPAQENVTGFVTYGSDRFALAVLYWDGVTNYGGGDFPAPPGMYAGGVLGFVGAGMHTWSVPAIGDSWVTGIDVDGSFNVVMAGDYVGSLMIDDMMKLGVGADRQTFFARMGTGNDDPDALNLVDYGSIQNDTGAFVVADGLGSFYYGGLFRAQITLGTDVMVSYGVRDGFIARINAAGTVDWAVQVGSSDDDAFGDAVVDASGNLIVGGSFAATMMFEDQALGDAQAGRDGFVLRIRPDGTLDHTWLQGSPGNTLIRHVAVAPDGTIAAAGETAGGIDFGAGMMPAVGDLDGVVIRYDPSGAPLWGAVLGSNAADRVNAVGFGDDNRLYVGLSHMSDVEWDGITIPNNTGTWLSSVIAMQ
jgi:hypothetical protein